ncbi:MAG TPA: sulfotransferase [Candidatus Saccharimonadales bacterium]|nr:sulfotransferase [Candidatus Saccharimonadales bacterium]
MHAPAREFVVKTLAEYGPITGDVVEFGSRDANGGVRDLFPAARSYLGIDSTDGEGVDLLCDAGKWQPDKAYACVITTETFEHAANWQDMLRVGAQALAPDGIMIVTCATAMRKPHSATVPDSRPQLGEYYGNVQEEHFRQAAELVGFTVEITINGNDLYAICRRRAPKGPLKIIGAGMWRTGTVSLKSALETLTEQPSHHMTELLIHPQQVNEWLSVVNGMRPNWDYLLHDYGSTLDWPSLAFWNDLQQTYPDALVLLSTRDPEEWWQSVSATVLKSAPTRETARSPWELLVVALFENYFVGRLPTKRQAIQAYNEHNDLVRRTVAPNRLIEWTPSDGWTPLCRALDKPIPDRPFPHLNTAAEYRRNNKVEG